MAEIECMISVYEDTTANLALALTARVAETTYGRVLWYDTTLDSLVYIRSGATAADYRYPLTLDNNYDSTTQIRRLTMNTAGWIGLGNAAARVVFTDAATDSIEMEDCAFHFNPDNDDFDFRLDGDNNDNVFYLDAGNDRIGVGISTPDTLLHLWNATAGAVAATAGSILTIENNSSAYIQFLTTASDAQGIYFGDAASATAAYILYNHGTGNLALYAEDDIYLYAAGATSNYIHLEEASDNCYVGGMYFTVDNTNGDGPTQTAMANFLQNNATFAKSVMLLEQADEDQPIFDFDTNNLTTDDVTWSSDHVGSANIGAILVRYRGACGAWLEGRVRIYSNDTA